MLCEASSPYSWFMKSRKARHKHCAGCPSFATLDGVFPGGWGWISSHPCASPFLLGLANRKPKQEFRQREKGEAEFPRFPHCLELAMPPLQSLCPSWALPDSRNCSPSFLSSLGMVKAWLQWDPNSRTIHCTSPKPLCKSCPVNKTSLNYFELCTGTHLPVGTWLIHSVCKWRNEHGWQILV